MGTADWWTEHDDAHRRIRIMLAVFRVYLVSDLGIENCVSNRIWKFILIHSKTKTNQPNKINNKKPKTTRKPV